MTRPDDQGAAARHADAPSSQILRDARKRYAEALTEEIHQESTDRMARWSAAGGPPLWFRVKTALRGRGATKRK